MNKLTLSAAALTAIVAPVQVQAADLSPEDKASEIKKVRKDLTDAINEIGKMDLAVQKIHLVTLSGISADIDSYDGTDKVLTEETVAGWSNLIDATKNDAEFDQMPYDSKKRLDDAIEAFQKEYKSALVVVNKYPDAGEIAKETLNGYYANVTKIQEKVNDFDLTKREIITQEPILEQQIKDNTELIGKLLEKIKDEDDAIRNTNSAVKTQEYFQAAYDAAKKAYMEQRRAVAETLKVYPYQDWIEAVNAQLNGQSRLLDELKAADDAQFEEVKKAPTDEKNREYAKNSLGRKTKAENAQKVIEGVLGGYKTGAENQDNAKEIADNKIAGFEKALTDIKSELKTRNINDFNEDIINVEGLIGKKKEEVKDKYELHEIYGYNLNLGVIETLLNNITSTGNKLIKNHDANDRMISSIEEANQNLKEAVSEAQKASEGKYEVVVNFDVEKTRIQTLINELKDAVEKAYNDKNAADYELSDFDIKPINDGINQYTDNTTTALTYYDKAQKNIKQIKEDRDALVDTVGEDGMTVVADLEDEKQPTYEDKIEAINREIQEIEKAVDTALAITDDVDKHMTALDNASNMSVTEKIDKLIEKYESNKVHHDKQLTIDAAQKVLDAASGKIDDIQKVIDSITGDFGWQKEEIDRKKNELAAKLVKLNTTFEKDEDVVAFTNEEATFEQKDAVAQNIIAALSKVIVDLEGEDGKGGIKKEVNDLKAEADAAVANTKAYKSVVETLIPNDINGVINAFKTKIDEVYPSSEEVSDDAKVFFEQECMRLEHAVEDAKQEMVAAWNNKTAVAKKADIELKLNDYKNEAKTLTGKIYLNKVQHESQEVDANSLMTTYKQQYDHILKYDKSDAAADYLQQLNEQKALIETLRDTTIPEAYKKGNSNTNPYKEDIEKEIDEINKKINDIVNASETDYGKNVNTANNLQRENFDKAYKAANDAFKDAVTTLTDFSNIQNGAIQTALANLIETHDEIYAYADSLRNLKTQEADDWNKYWEKYKAEEKFEYGADIYNAQAAVDTAVKYMNDILKLKFDYQNNVNKKALDLYQSKVENAEWMIAYRKAQIDGFIYDGKNKAFQEADDIMAAVKEACALDSDGNVSDKYFAVHIDENEWLVKLDNIYGGGDGLLDELQRASEAENEKRVNDVTKLYCSEYEIIASHDELKDYSGRNFIDALKSLKERTIDKATAKDLIVDYDNVISTIIPMCAEYASYTSTDDKYELDHSRVYNDAVAALDNIEANDKAYSRMVVGISELESGFNDVKKIVKELIVGHQDGDTNDALTSIEEGLEDAKTGLETTRKNLGCVLHENSKYVVFVSSIEGQIESLKTTAVKEEIEKLNEKLDEVKEEYNQAAKENLDQVSDYDNQIADLYKTLKDIKGRFESTDPNTVLDFEDAVKDLVKQETEIARVNKELNAMYDNDRTDAAVTNISGALTDVDEKIKSVEKLVEYNKGEHDNVIQDKYLEQVQALRGEYSLIEADYEAKENAGQILFFQKNILHDLSVLLADTKTVSDELTTIYDKHVENNDVYEILNTSLNNCQSKLSDAYDKIKDFEYWEAANNPDYEKLIDQKKVELESEITVLKNKLDWKHGDVELTIMYNGISVDISKLSDNIEKFERDAKHHQANSSLEDLKNDILNSYNKIDVNKKAGRKYDTAREIELRKEYCRINRLSDRAISYNNDAKEDNYVYRDIDGNPVEDSYGNIAEKLYQDYNTEAWAILDERIKMLKNSAEKLAADVDGCSFRQGDVDQNDKVNVNDYSEVRNIILNAQSYEDVMKEAQGRALAADCNEDKDINVADLTGVSNILLHGKWDWSPAGNGARNTRAKVSAEDQLSISNEGEETTVFGKTVRMAVNLAHSEAFTAGQMDITMPQGMKIVGQSMSDRANGHDIFANDLGNGVTRLLTATIDNNEFNGRNGALIYLDVEVGSDFSGGQISIDNIIFSDAAGRMYSMSSIGGNGDGATGIGDIKAATVKERIYSIGGQVMKNVKKGINIIVGEDGKAKKVVNK